MNIYNFFYFFLFLFLFLFLFFCIIFIFIFIWAFIFIFNFYFFFWFIYIIYYKEIQAHVEECLTNLENELLEPYQQLDTLNQLIGVCRLVGDIRIFVHIKVLLDRYYDSNTKVLLNNF